MSSSSILGRNTHFAIAAHVLTVLAYFRDKPVPSAKIAESVDTNPAFLRQLIGQLKDLGYVTSIMGTGGGAMLAKDPDSINLANLHRDLEGDVHFNTHTGNTGKCAVALCISETFDELSKEIDENIHKVLSETSISDLVNKSVKLHTATSIANS